MDWRRVLVVAWLAVAGCVDATPTSVLLRVEAEEGVTPPDVLAIWVFAAEGRVVSGEQFPLCDDPSTCKVELPDDVVLYPKQEEGMLRLLVQGQKAGAITGEGTTEVELERGKQKKATVVLQAGPLPDGDRDGVPDEIDNCPNLPNPDQGPCSPDGGLPDGGADAVSDGPILVDIPTKDLPLKHDHKPQPDLVPKPDLKPWPDLVPAPDLKPWPDLKPLPDLKPWPDLVPPPPDSGPSSPCAQGSVAKAYQNNMVICDTLSSYDQCGASQICNVAGGWTLCTASQFRSRGGASQSAPTMAWLASCIRDGASPMSPTNAVCSCSGTTGSSADIAWTCTGVLWRSMTQLHVGVCTTSDCRRIGLNDAANEAIWRQRRSDSALSAVVCCN